MFVAKNGIWTSKWKFLAIPLKEGLIQSYNQVAPTESLFFNLSDNLKVGLSLDACRPFFFLFRQRLHSLKFYIRKKNEIDMPSKLSTSPVCMKSLISPVRWKN